MLLSVQNVFVLSKSSSMSRRAKRVLAILDAEADRLFGISSGDEGSDMELDAQVYMHLAPGSPLFISSEGSSAGGRFRKQLHLPVGSPPLGAGCGFEPVAGRC